jgi:hypothetical protein
MMAHCLGLIVLARNDKLHSLNSPVLTQLHVTSAQGADGIILRIETDDLSK